MPIMKERYRLLCESHSISTGVDLYRNIYPEIPSPRNEVYLSRPMTSGSIKDLFFELARGISPQTMAIVLETNNRISEFIAQELRSYFNDKQLVFPRPLQFGEFNGISFWMYFLSGLNPKDAQWFDKLVREKKIVSFDLFNDHQAEKGERLKEYFELAGKFLGFVQKNNLSLNPVSEMVLFPDHQQSLGCSLEREVAKSLGILTREAVFDQNHPRFQTSIFQQLIRPLIIDESLWQHVKDYRFSIPTVSGNGENLIVLRDLPS